MKNKYVDFISDEHFLNCVGNLHQSYLKAKNNISKKKFYANKIDVIKLTFDAKFNDIDEELLIQTEILRQIDKSINNSIGTFHEQILGGVKGYEVGNLSGFDIRATDDTLFADIKNKHNTMNSNSEKGLFLKLADFADKHKKAKCYWVQILAKKTFLIPWRGIINGKEHSHSRVFKISGDQFYSMIIGQEDAFAQMYRALPFVIRDYLSSIDKTKLTKANSAVEELNSDIEKSNRTILNQISFENYSYYLGFDKL